MNEDAIRLSFTANQIQQLKTNPLRTVIGRMSGRAFDARILIPDYDQRIEEEYSDCVDLGLMDECSRIGLPFTLNQFGLRIVFQEAVMIEMYHEGMTLEPNSRRVVEAFGPLFLENAYLPARNRTDGHNARFEHLNFHRDRGSHQQEQVSIYLRNPFDEIQAQPRTISTLFIANIVAHLQNKREGGDAEPGNEGPAMRYRFF
ncbi:MAG TPA: hypothetical protein EYN96_02940 [Candidatus Hydrogenedentes bacterium]|nr:hypothetical protein [Candidatus Hydrogenedentota bacterium]